MKLSTIKMPNCICSCDSCSPCIPCTVPRNLWCPNFSAWSVNKNLFVLLAAPLFHWHRFRLRPFVVWSLTQSNQ